MGGAISSVTSLLSKPKAPTVAPPPPPPVVEPVPTKETAEKDVNKEQERARRVAAQMGGRARTILSGADDVGSATTTRKLLGG